MEKSIHFEQLIEEVRAANPQAQTIWVTENPLSLAADDAALAPEPYLHAHQPAWLTVSSASLVADGLTTVTVHACFPACARQPVRILLRQGATTLEETLALDDSGEGDIEICTATAADIQVALAEKPVRLDIPVLPAEVKA